jgi:cobyrinic acid a,c-diamide synthase
MSEVGARITIAGTSGDAGKTLLSLGLLGAWRRRKLKTVAFKKGPDFIDAAWLGRAAGQTARNLDSFLMDDRAILRSFVTHAAGADIAVIEGNRGIHDGRDAQGTHSTAALAAMLESPVILIHQVRKATRTAAAAMMGCCTFDSRITIAGVVLNGVAGKRHRDVITESLAAAGGPPVVGAIPQLDGSFLPGRHLGLVTPEEHPVPEKVLQQATDIVSEYVDIDRVFALAGAATPLSNSEPPVVSAPVGGGAVRLGYFRDSAFSFYYPENLEALRRAGAELIAVSSLTDTMLPETLDGLYLGGGFPETHAVRLADNSKMRESVRRAAAAGMPMYAECGGLVYLGESLTVDDRMYPLAGVFPVRLTLEKKPQGHGYARLIVDSDNPFFAAGTLINAHEFHYTHITESVDDVHTACAVDFGAGALAGRDGLTTGRVMACYAHLHALGTPAWAPAFIRLAREYRAGRIAGPHMGCHVCCAVSGA